MPSVEVEIADNIEQYGQTPWRYLPKQRKDHAKPGTRLYRPYVGNDFEFGHKIHKGKRLMVWIQEGVISSNTTVGPEGSANLRESVQLIQTESGAFVPDDGKWFYEKWQATSEAAKIVLDKKQWLLTQGDELLCETNKLYQEWKDKNARSQ